MGCFLWRNYRSDVRIATFCLALEHGRRFSLRFHSMFFHIENYIKIIKKKKHQIEDVIGNLNSCSTAKVDLSDVWQFFDIETCIIFLLQIRIHFVVLG